MLVPNIVWGFLIWLVGGVEEDVLLLLIKQNISFTMSYVCCSHFWLEFLGAHRPLGPPAQPRQSSQIHLCAAHQVGIILYFTLVASFVNSLAQLVLGSSSFEKESKFPTQVDPFILSC